MCERTIIERDPFLGPQDKSLKYFFEQGPAMLSQEDQTTGHVGQIIREIIRYRLLVPFYATGQLSVDPE